jgi:tetratricopeptide (TPR) repeat protein
VVELGRLEWYRDVANAADRMLRPAERANFESAPPAEGFANQAAALRWLDAEAANLSAAVREAALEQPVLSWQIAAAMYGWLTRRERRAEWIALYQVAAGAAARAGDQAGEALITGRLGIAYGLSGQPTEAIAAFRLAHELRLAAGDLLGAATGLLNMAAVQIRAGTPGAAIATLTRAEALTNGLAGTAHFDALLHGNLAEAQRAAGRLAPALHHYETALRHAEANCADRDLAHILVGLAEVCGELGRDDRLRGYAERGLELADRTGDDLLAAQAREVLGHSAVATGDTLLARAHLLAALQAYTELGHPATDGIHAALRDLDARVPAG